ncbi:MAG: ADP-dependent glucokinase/phosphofructokinase [Planctomycetes bacterium]|nr:ADP-dependent glucokinase/phosphofructokinase [Planctomycetota bacterium]HPY74506.1 ADP-dependent glucokinase/phosphofructokinase [Planctomycetota bacterium]HQB00109.1 ADP-dependent glucokinase/phosphofructokinase [Planctomycetota bacterium]
MKKNWQTWYKIAKEKIENFPNIGGIISAWNTNIDAVVKLSGSQIKTLLQNYTTLDNQEEKIIHSPQDVLRGLIQCFENGIAEEWIVSNEETFEWMKKNIGYQKLQMGGQGGIIANTAAVCGIHPVFVHCASLPKMQADLFLDLDNLLSFNQNNEPQKACQIDRSQDIPLIHWILEFDGNDSFTFQDKTITCPKSNRFIATYDPLNLLLHIDPAFQQGIQKTEQKINFIFLAGYHLLQEILYNGQKGEDKIKNSMDILQQWKIKHKDSIVHFEFASTQDISMRETMLNKIATQVDSLGCNERELIDILEILNLPDLQKKCNETTNSIHLFQGLLHLFQYLQIPRIQLHMFGLYITISQKTANISPTQNRDGMITAATIAATKAGTGTVYDKDNLLWGYGKEIHDVSVQELQNLHQYLTEQFGSNDLDKTGIAQFPEFDIIAVPTIVIDKPITLVGMGDTISSISLLAAKA